jgi:hypothetical protein
LRSSFASIAPVSSKRRSAPKSTSETWTPTVSGGDLEEATPDPIPNSEVKLFGADGTAREAVWESRTPPGLSFKRLESQGSSLLPFKAPSRIEPPRRQGRRGGLLLLGAEKRPSLTNPQPSAPSASWRFKTKPGLERALKTYSNCSTLRFWPALFPVQRKYACPLNPTAVGLPTPFSGVSSCLVKVRMPLG